MRILSRRLSVAEMRTFVCHISVVNSVATGSAFFFQILFVGVPCFLLALLFLAANLPTAVVVVVVVAVVVAVWCHSSGRGGGSGLMLR